MWAGNIIGLSITERHALSTCTGVNLIGTNSPVTTTQMDKIPHKNDKGMQAPIRYRLWQFFMTVVSTESSALLFFTVLDLRTFVEY